MRDSSIGFDGRFIVFEGIDGSGTTTQAARFGALMRARKRTVHITHEPSSGPIGSLIRLVLSERLVLPAAKSAQSLALLFAADRIDHIECDIAPHLRDGYVVVSDRYDLSSLTYQTAAANTPDPAAQLAWIRELNKHARRPDVTVVLDVSPSVAAARRRERGGARELYDDADLQARLAAAYRRAEELVPGDKIVHIDGDQDVDTVAAAISSALDRFL